MNNFKTAFLLKMMTSLSTEILTPFTFSISFRYFGVLSSQRILKYQLTSTQERMPILFLRAMILLLQPRSSCMNSGT